MVKTVLKILPALFIPSVWLIVFVQSCSPNLYSPERPWEAVSIAPPKEPQPYQVPTGAVRVSNTAEFIRQFTSTTPEDIVLTDGLYDNASPVKAGAAHRVWAAHVGNARLTFGLEFDSDQGAPGAAVHGLSFDIKNRAAGARDGPAGDPRAARAAVRIAGINNSRFSIEDVTIYGNRAIDAGIKALNSDGLIVRRCAVSDVLDYGVFAHAFGNEVYTVNVRTPAVIEDCDIKNVYRAPRASNNGKSEACLWVGVNASVERVRLHNCGWMGLWTGGNTNDSHFADLSIDDSDTGIYVEHWTRRSTFERFQIGPSKGLTGSAGFRTSIGITTEWADPAYAGLNPVFGQSLAASHDNTFKDGTINSFVTGIFTDDSQGTTISNVRFFNQRFSGISEFRNSKSGYDSQWQGRGNDFSGLSAGAEPYNRSHVNNFKE